MKTIRGFLKTWPGLAAWVLSIGFVSYVPAQSYAEKMTELEKVRVTAVEMEERLTSELAQYGNQVEIITREDIDRTGHTDIVQILDALVPGIYGGARFGRGSGNQTNFLMQGSDGRSILFMVDGVRINSRLYGRGDLDVLTAGAIERIEVVKNGQSLFYGTEATAGIINFVTKKVSKETKGSHTISYGSLADRAIGGDISTTIDGHGVLLFADAEATDGYDPFRFKGSKNLNQRNAKSKDRKFERQNAGVKYRRELSDGQTMNFFFVRNEFRHDFPRSANHYHSENDREDILTYVKWEDVRDERRQFFAKASYHEWWSKWTRIKGYPAALEFDALSNAHQWGYEDWSINLMGDFKPASGDEYIVGADYQNSWGKDEVVSVPPTKHSEVMAGFLQYRPHFKSMPDLKVALGSRYNHIRSGATKTVWNINVKRPLTERTYFRGIYGSAFRLPTTNELGQVSTTGGTNGNPNLKPEESLGLDVGIGGSGSYGNAPVRWDIGYFLYEISDRITDNGVLYINANRARFKGWEVQWGIEPSPTWSFDLSWSMADAKESTDIRHVEKRPKWFGKGTLKYRPATARLYIDGIDLIGRFVGSVYEYTAGLTDLNYGKYFVGDVSFFKAFGAQKDHRVTIKVENFTDQDYTAGVGNITAANLPAGVTRYHEENRGLPRNVVLSYSRGF